MPLSVGDRLGPYEILAPIGKGGMGEVYRARDTKLKRDVALKVLPEVFARDPERMARFQREAEVLASLNHPNIATIHGVEDRALVMELVEGNSPKGPLPFDEAWRIASQIAAALEYAHERGIVHRDLKPANILITSEGVVKLLDFGLAKAFSNQREPSTSPENSPTLTLGATEIGVILGTAAYMAPEQARGKTVDKRADIWSFGVVLYELLTGERLFSGEDAAETLAAVIHKQPDLAKVPRQARRLLEECLQKDPKQRLRDIGDAKRLLGGEPPAQPAPATWHRSWLPWCIAAFLLLTLMPANILHFRETPPPEHTLRYTIAPPENSAIHTFAVSPDGRMVVIAAAVDGKRQLWLRPLDALQAQPMPTTEGATYPFWSPDSRNIAFFASGKLRRIAASGGPSQQVCDSRDGAGGTWNRDDVILFSPSLGDNVIRRVPAAGGVPTDVTNTKVVSQYPAFLSDGRHFLYTVPAASQEQNGTYVSSLDGVENRRVLADNSGVAFAPPSPGSRIGHLLFLRENILIAQPFDVGSAQLAGEVFPVAEGISFVQTNFPPVSVSENGVLLYLTGGAGGGGNDQIVWYDRSGKILETVGTPSNVLMPAISPDEKMIAFSRGVGLNRDVWLRDLVRGNERRLTTDGSANAVPFWSPKGDRIVFSSRRGARTSDLYLRASKVSGQDEPLLSTPNSKNVNQWSRDGRFIVYMDSDPKTKLDLWYLAVGDAGAPAGKAMPFLHSEFNEFYGQLSPDSRWMAYTSDVSGQREVYVQPFPAADNEMRISIAGGEQPRWRGDGKELFYLAADGKLTAVEVKASAGPNPSFKAGAPVALFDAHIASTTNAFNYDVTADGKRFLVAATPTGPATSPPLLTVLVNWNAGTKK